MDKRGELIGHVFFIEDNTFFAKKSFYFDSFKGAPNKILPKKIP